MMSAGIGGKSSLETLLQVPFAKNVTNRKAKVSFRIFLVNQCSKLKQGVSVLTVGK